MDLDFQGVTSTLSQFFKSINCLTRWIYLTMSLPTCRWNVALKNIQYLSIESVHKESYVFTFGRKRTKIKLSMICLQENCSFYVMVIIRVFTCFCWSSSQLLHDILEDVMMRIIILTIRKVLSGGNDFWLLSELYFVRIIVCALKFY